MKFSIFAFEKNLYILHGQVFQNDFAPTITDKVSRSNVPKIRPCKNMFQFVSYHNNQLSIL